MLFKNLHINPDSVQLDEQLIERPFYMAPSVWIDFWEEIVQETSRNEIRSLCEELDGSQKEINVLKNEVYDLENEVKSLENQIGLLEEELTNSYRE